MQFIAIYKPRENFDESAQERALMLFTQWQPPEGFTFVQHWVRADGQGGVALVEADDTLAIHKVTTTFEPFYVFDVHPVVGLETAIPAIYQAIQWRKEVP